MLSNMLPKKRLALDGSCRMKALKGKHGPMAAKEKSSLARGMKWFTGKRPVWQPTCPSQTEVPRQTWSPFPAVQSAAQPAPACQVAARAAPAASAQGSGSAPRAPAGAARLEWLSRRWPSMGPAGTRYDISKDGAV